MGRRMRMHLTQARFSPAPVLRLITSGEKKSRTLWIVRPEKVGVWWIGAVVRVECDDERR
jgi:hypothetical protein